MNENNAEMMFEGLGSFGAHDLDLKEARRRAGESFRKQNGLDSGGERAKEYEAFLFPNDAEWFRTKAADDMWSCALRLLGSWRLWGVKHRCLSEPYESRVGKAVADCVRVADTFRALITGPGRRVYVPDAGDAFCSLPESGAQTGEHISCVVSQRSDEKGRVLLECSDGGQGKRGSMAIEPREYLWQNGTIARCDGPRYSVDMPGPRREVRWVVSFVELAVNAELLR